MQEDKKLSGTVKTILVITLFGVMTFLTLNIHSRCGIFNYHSEIFSDKAGYYVYLPATFIYDFNSKKFPDSIEYKTGEGFLFDRINNKVTTRYPYGVALLELPFFAGAHIISIIQGEPSNGFTQIYNHAIDIAAVFYLVLGIFFLFKFLIFYFDDRTVGWALFFFLFGTNLLFYSFRETGMSHIYSFFLISAFLFCWKNYLSGNEQIKWMVFIGFLIGGIIVVRPINAVFISIFLFLDAVSFKERIIRLFSLKYKIFIIALCAFVLIVPQLIYYIYLYGKPIAYSYGNEAFIYKFSPQIHRVLFTFHNGLFIYNPIHVFTIAGMFMMIKKKMVNGYLALLLFISITMLYASWWSPMLGCGFGHRGFVEFYPFLAIPFTFVINKMLRGSSSIIKISLFFLMFVMLVYNIKLSYAFDGCWYGKGPWDFEELKRLIFYRIFIT